MGGTGKSHVIRAIMKTLQGKGKKGATFATTGIAAVNIGGSALHSCCQGFAISTGKKYLELSKKNLRRLQNLYGDLDFMFIDEVSMKKQREVFWLHKRLCKIRGKSKHFGGICILMVGDMGQLPPVGGSVLWNEKSSEDADKN